MIISLYDMIILSTCYTGVKLCYIDQLIGVKLPPCLPGYWYTCIVDQFPPELGETVGKEVQVCDMGSWPGQCVRTQKFVALLLIKLMSYNNYYP